MGPIDELRSTMATAPTRGKRRPKRSKLFYKHRWLVSVDVVTALRRAGVVCDIVVPGHETIPYLNTFQGQSPKLN